MALPESVNDLSKGKANYGCTDCGHETSNRTYYMVEGSPFCKVACIERWHGIRLRR